MTHLRINLKTISVNLDPGLLHREAVFFCPSVLPRKRSIKARAKKGLITMRRFLLQLLKSVSICWQRSKKLSSNEIIKLAGKYRFSKEVLVFFKVFHVRS